MKHQAILVAVFAVLAAAAPAPPVSSPQAPVVESSTTGAIIESFNENNHGGTAQSTVASSASRTTATSQSVGASTTTSSTASASSSVLPYSWGTSICSNGVAVTNEGLKLCGFAFSHPAGGELTIGFTLFETDDIYNKPRRSALCTRTASTGTKIEGRCGNGPDGEGEDAPSIEFSWTYDESTGTLGGQEIYRSGDDNFDPTKGGSPPGHYRTFEGTKIPATPDANGALVFAGPLSIPLDGYVVG